MNLTELQTELRSIEEHLSALQKEIGRMKPETEEEKKEDFARITKLAIQYPIKGTKVSRVSPILQKEYIQTLSWLILSSENSIYDKLLYLYRIAAGCGMETCAEELYQAGLEFQTEDMERISMDFQELKYAFLTDALVIANISGEASEKEISLIADVARVFWCEKWEIKIAGLVAKGVLTGEWNILDEAPEPKKNRGNIVENYKGLISEKWLISHRRACGRLCVEKNDSIRGNFFLEGKPDYICTVERRLQAGERVKKGDVLVTYEEIPFSPLSGAIKSGFFRAAIGGSMNSEKKTITAPCDGTVFFLEDSRKDDGSGKEDKYLVVYVVSCFDVYQDFLNWYSQNKKMQEEKQ